MNIKERINCWWKGVVKNLSKLGKFAKRMLSLFEVQQVKSVLFSKFVLVPIVASGSVNLIITSIMIKTIKPTPLPPPTPSPIVERLLVPISKHVHFENAKFEGNRLVKGVTLGGTRKTSMREMLNGLEHCGDANTPVKVKVYGFASNDKFRGYTQLESEIRNLKAANKRASNVYSVLNEHLQESFDSRDWIQLEDPKPWPEPQALDALLETSPEMHEMRKKRNDLIKSDTTMRDPLDDRAVVLDLVDPGICKVL